MDVRVVAATNRDLKTLIAEGQFRQDLYYRIATFEVPVPPLRERREDVPLLVQYFLAKLSGSDSSERPAVVEAEALNLLASYDWPGNVRELENVINRLVVIAGQSTITLGDAESVLDVELSCTPRVSAEYGANARGETKLVLPPNTAELSEDETIRAYMRRVKLDVFTAAVSQYPNKTAAAERLGLTKETLRRQMRYLRQVAARKFGPTTTICFPGCLARPTDTLFDRLFASFKKCWDVLAGSPLIYFDLQGRLLFFFLCLNTF